MILDRGKKARPMPHTHFVSTDLVGKSKWDEHRDIITEAYKELGGIRGIIEIAGVKRSEAQRLARRFGLNGTCKPMQDAEAKKARTEQANRRHLMTHWGWNPKDDTLVLLRGRMGIATSFFRCGKEGIRIRKGDKYTQYQLPRGAAREYLESHGVKYYRAGLNTVPASEVSKGVSHLTIKEI